MITDELRDQDRAAAVRALLRRPLLVRDDDPETFALCAVHRIWLVDWFERNCGWTLQVDVPAGTARLAKRRARIDSTRPARRTDGAALDRRGYVLLMTMCAELVTRPHTTVSDLARAVQVATGADDQLPTFDPTNRAHRYAFVHALRVLVGHHLVEVTAGAVDDYGADQTDAVLRADVSRLAALPVTVAAPSRAVHADHDTTLAALSHEPRYGTAADATDEQTTMRARHQLTRALLDDPAVAVDTLDQAQLDYLATPGGRKALARAVHEAGMELEHHRDVLLAVDPTGESSDGDFGRRATTVLQAAGAVLKHLDSQPDHTSTTTSVTAVVAGLLAADERWARGYQDTGGQQRLAADALQLLAEFALTATDDTHVRLRPAAGRFELDLVDSRPTTPDTDDADDADDLEDSRA